MKEFRIKKTLLRDELISVQDDKRKPNNGYVMKV
jgi:hypothetical protein